MSRKLIYYIAFFSFMLAFTFVGVFVDSINSQMTYSRYFENFDKDHGSDSSDCPWIEKHIEENKDKVIPVNFDTKAPVKII